MSTRQPRYNLASLERVQLLATASADRDHPPGAALGVQFGAHCNLGLAELEPRILNHRQSDDRRRLPRACDGIDDQWE